MLIKRHHQLLIIFSLVMMVSVFFLSCGIPSFCSLNNISITSSFNDNVYFSVIGKDSDLSLVEKGPGLLIMYILSENEISEYSYLTNKSNGLILKFSNSSDYGISIDSNNLIMEYQYNSDSPVFSLKAFEKYNKTDDSSDSVIKPLYTHNLSSYISSNTFKDADFMIDLFSSNETGVVFDLYNVSDKQNPVYIGSISANIPEETNYKYIYMYTAFSAEVGQFSNNYWSDLKYLGSYSI